VQYLKVADYIFLSQFQFKKHYIFANGQTVIILFSLESPAFFAVGQEAKKSFSKLLYL
jgi:hypothetical protein